MPYIYKITNILNNKIYIGKTLRTIEQRWQEHQKDYLKPQKEKRPLYSAMKKYGIENFKIEQVEECSSDILEEREKYWIEYFGSFKNGYNATLGGDGKSYIDYDLVVITYKELQNITKVAEILNLDRGTVSKILKIKNEKIIDASTINQQNFGKPVNQYDKNGNYIRSFPSAKNAAIELGKIKKSTDRGAASHIADVCKGKRKTAYGYIWKYSE